MNAIETRNSVRQMVVKNQFKFAIQTIFKWGFSNGNDWVANEANRLLDELAQSQESDYPLLADRIFALADCIVTGGFPEMSGVEKRDESGSASSLEFNSASEMSSEISGMSDLHADISEGMPPMSASMEHLEVESEKKSARPPQKNGGFPPQNSEKMPTTSGKSKPIFSASPPPPTPPPPPPPPPPPMSEIAAATAPMPAKLAPIPEIIPIETPQMGGLLYNIPSKMKQNEDTTCIVRIAFDKGQLKTTDDTFTEEVVKDVRVSRLMEVDIENEGTEEVFRIVAKSEKQQSLDTFEATEWRFAVRPLMGGKRNLLLKVTVVETDTNGKETRKVKVLEEKVSISTKKVKNTEGGAPTFLSADLKLKDLKTLLFMGANPPGTRILQLEVEHSRIATKINNRYRIEVEKFLSASEMPELIISKAPSIIHFSGHGKDGGSGEQGETDGTTRLIGLPTDADSEGGIVVFDDTMRGLKVIDNAALEFMFDSFKNTFNLPIEVVVFNSCYSESQAKTIGKFVPYVVGSARAIKDDIAIAFASGFYFGMSQGLTVEKAFNSGKMQAVLADFSAKDLIVLYRNGAKLNV